MILKAALILLNFYALVFSGNNADFCTDRLDQSVAIPVENQVIDVVEVSIQTFDLYLRQGDLRAVLSENTLDEERTEVPLLLVPHIPFFFIYNGSISIENIKLVKYKIHKRTERNFIPVPHASRSILFHTLQINC